MNSSELDKKPLVVGDTKPAATPAPEPATATATEPAEVPTEPATAPEPKGGAPNGGNTLKGGGGPQSGTSAAIVVRKFPTWLDLFAACGVFVLSALLGSLVAFVIMHARGLENITPELTCIYYVIQMLPVIGFLVWQRYKAGRRSGIHLGLRNVNMPMVLWGLVVMLASGVVLEPLLVLFPTEAYQSVTDTIGLGGWAILSTVVLAPILEEVLFRGLVLESCRERFGRGAAVLISALLFGLVHGVPVQMVNAFVIGLILGYVYISTRSLLATILLHAINNGLSYVGLALFSDTSQLTLHELISAEWLYWSVYAISSLIFIYAMYRLVMVLRDHTELE